MDDKDSMKEFTIGLVGPCTSGKSVLRERLIAYGYLVRHIAQEHSFVKDMWRRLSNPDVLVFLDVSYPTTLKRRNWKWNESDYQEQHRRLAHARIHANLYINTDELTPDQVLEKVLRFLLTRQIKGVQTVIANDSEESPRSQ